MSTSSNTSLTVRAKKGGEFYTPSEVVRMMVQLIEPKEGMGIYDPCAGSGGMLIQSKQYVQEVGGDSRNLELAGQELNGGTWAICKMNMLLHGVRSADVRQGDTIKEPQHLDKKGEIRRFDRVIANPPFSQNYLRSGMQFAERFHTFLPESGKKADLMFVQHMVASLKSDGRMAVVMPHGVLFRGGEEKACRQKFINDGILEAVIGLPAGLFYGTGILALEIRKKIQVEDSRDILNLRNLLFLHRQIGDAYQKSDRWDEAILSFEEGRKLGEEIDKRNGNQGKKFLALSRHASFELHQSRFMIRQPRETSDVEPARE